MTLVMAIFCARLYTVQYIKHRLFVARYFRSFARNFVIILKHF